MTNFQTGLISLIRSALGIETVKMPDDFDWNECLKVSKKHQILCMVFYGIINSKIDVPSDIYEEFEKATYNAIVVNTNQYNEFSILTKAFEEKEIEYMPLKGCILKYLYPKPEMRVMGDVDILIKETQKEKIQSVLNDLNYTDIKENEYEIIWKKNGFYLELHKHLIPPRTKDYYEYFDNGWKFAKKSADGNYRYEMSKEDTFVYIFSHFAKHYRDSGIGIKHIVDFWLYNNAYPELDKVYLSNCLEKLGLNEFYQNILKTLEVWLGDSKPDKKTDFITDTLFENGVYGIYNKHIAATALQENNSSGNVYFKRLFRLIFLPFGEMCEKYSFLNKLPFLLPVMWVIRWFSAITVKAKNLKVHKNYLELSSSEKVYELKKALNYVGLEFKNKD